MKYIILLIALITLTSCMSDHNARISVNVFAPPGQQIKLLGEDPAPNPSANSSTNASSGSGITIVIKHMTKDINVPTGVTATVPASTFGF